MNRETLEAVALDVVSPDLYYDLADTIHEVTDGELIHIINCSGDYEKELAL